LVAAIWLQLAAVWTTSLVAADPQTNGKTPAAADKHAQSSIPISTDSFDSNGVKIHYVTAGEGEPVVLIHGFTADWARNWKLPGVFDALARHYKVIAVDNRGHGQSGKPHDPARYGTEMVEDVVRLLDHLKIDKAHVVGYSMGGFITDKLLTVHPERVISATLGGAGWAKENDERMNFIDELAESLDAGKGITPLILRLVPAGQPKPSDEQIQTINGMIMLTNDQKALAAVIRGMKKLSVTETALKKNRVPTLALIGELDPLKAGVDDLSKVMPDLKVVVIEGADHMSAFNKPQFVEALEDFLAEHSREPAAAVGK
jgi:pimeloyl-ACP methyl ester carboxylesterase